MTKLDVTLQFRGMTEEEQEGFLEAFSEVLEEDGYHFSLVGEVVEFENPMTEEEHLQCMLSGGHAIG